MGLGVRDWFSVVLGGIAFPSGSLTPSRYSRPWTTFELTAQRVAMVGDGVHDIEAGRAAGVVTIGVSYGVAGSARLEAEARIILLIRFKNWMVCCAEV